MTAESLVLPPEMAAWSAGVYGHPGTCKTFGEKLCTFPQMPMHNFNCRQPGFLNMNALNHLRPSTVCNCRQREENCRSFLWLIRFIYQKKLDSFCFAKLLLFQAKNGLYQAVEQMTPFWGCVQWMSWDMTGFGKRQKKKEQLSGMVLWRKGLQPSPPVWH